MSRTRAQLGDLTSLVSDLKTSVKSQAQEEAMAYASELYYEYETQIWLAGLSLAAWIMWVSFRDTCSKCHAEKVGE